MKQSPRNTVLAFRAAQTRTSLYVGLIAKLKSLQRVFLKLIDVRAWLVVNVFENKLFFYPKYILFDVIAFKVDTVFCVIKHFNYYPFNHGTFVLSISYI